MKKNVFKSASNDSKRIRVDAGRDAQVLNFSKKNITTIDPNLSYSVLLRIFAYFLRLHPCYDYKIATIMCLLCFFEL